MLRLTSCSMRFGYELATGRWTIESIGDRPTLLLASTGRIVLVDAEGCCITRDVACAAFVDVERLDPTSGSESEEFRVRRAWPDGLVTTQSFALEPDAAILKTSLAVRSTGYQAAVARAIDVVASPKAEAANLTVIPDLAGVLDFGWTATAPPRRLTVTDAEDVVATGLAALGRESSDQSLVLAFVDGRAVVGEYRFGVGHDWCPRVSAHARQIKLLARAWVGGVDVGPDGVTSGPLWICVDRLDRVLPLLAARLGARSGVDVEAEPVVVPSAAVPSERARSMAIALTPSPGCSLQSDTAALDEASVLGSLARARAADLTSVVDQALLPDGWQAPGNDLLADPRRFPGGLAALVGAIHDASLRAILGVAPLSVRPSSAVYRDHPTWLAHSSSGDPVTMGPADERAFALDLSLPTVREWLRSLGRQIADWGFDGARVASAPLVSHGWSESAATSPLCAYRGALAALRDGLAHRSLALADGALLAALDLVDVLETDSRPLDRADAAPLLRAFLGRAGLLTSAGPILIGRPGQTIEEARAAATIGAFAGGAMTLADAATTLAPERVQVARACLPPLRLTLLPLNPFSATTTWAFQAMIHQHAEEWRLVVALNPSDRPHPAVVSAKSINLSGPHHGFEFWTQSYLGVITDQLVLDEVPAGGCRVVALRPVQDVPQVIGTSLHVGLGALELHDASWEKRFCDLRLTLAASGDREGSIVIAAPPGWVAGLVRGAGGSFSLQPRGDHLVEIHCRFRELGEAQVTFWPANSAA